MAKYYDIKTEPLPLWCDEKTPYELKVEDEDILVKPICSTMPTREEGCFFNKEDRIRSELLNLYFDAREKVENLSNNRPLSRCEKITILLKTFPYRFYCMYIAKYIDHQTYSRYMLANSMVSKISKHKEDMNILNRYRAGLKED